MKQRRTKTVYSYNEKGLFVGLETAFETWDLAEPPIFLIPANSTEVEVPSFDSKTEQAIFNTQTNSWEVRVIPTEENTPKPEYDETTHKVVWNENHWDLVELPTQENTPKPEYDSNLFTCEWNQDGWELILIPTWDIVRGQRNLLLTQSDWAVMPDSNPKPSKEAWLTYRQALRDVPSAFKTPEEVVWPEKPE